MSLSPIQIVVVVLLVVLLFGGKRIGEMGKGLGEGIKNFKKGIADDEPVKKIDSAKKDEEEEKS